jgi:peptidoglycan/xylan/chitin deacetylase (PgdA/CDA1 family)
MASITFDDFPKSAWEAGGRILDRLGVKATYYTSARFCGAVTDGEVHYDGDDLRAVWADGHEIGCHTASHAPLSLATAGDLEEEARANARFLHREVPGLRATTFAYPYGALNFATKRAAARRFTGCRGTLPGINRGWVDPGYLRAVCLERRILDAAPVEPWIDQTVAQTGWLILLTHDVAADPSPYGITPSTLEATLTRMLEAGIVIRPVGAVCADLFGTPSGSAANAAADAGPD